MLAETDPELEQNVLKPPEKISKEERESEESGGMEGLWQSDGGMRDKITGIGRVVLVVVK